jgi:mannosyltransferase
MTAPTTNPVGASVRRDEDPDAAAAHRPLAGRLWVVAAVAALLAGLVLRFVAHTDLWLDEAQSVAIARQPLAGLFAALRQDGSPPLYYLLLHYWMVLFGAGNIAVRALSGLISVGTLPAFWLLARRTIGRPAAVPALLLLASSPFALRYATETRMYALVVLLTTLGGLALSRVLDDQRRTPWAVAGLAASTGLLLLTHYWALYGLAAAGLWLLPGAVRGPRRRANRIALAAMAGGALLLVPWLPSFRYQLQHTGTPWAGGTTLAEFVNTIFGWSGRGDAAGRALDVAVLVLFLLGIFGRATADGQVVLHLRGRAPGRLLAALSMGTLAIPVVLGMVANQAFSLRYTSMAFVPFVLVVALGLHALPARRVQHTALAVVVVLSLVDGTYEANASRTQANRIAKMLSVQLQPGDVVAFCPDQLGPAVDRLLPGGVDQVVYPTLGSAVRVNWVDYGRRNQSAAVPGFVDALDRRAAGHDLWLVWAAGYRTTSAQCRTVVSALRALRPINQVVMEPSTAYERAQLVHYQPAP